MELPEHSRGPKLLQDFRREARITPAMPPLLTYLLGLVPTLCLPGTWAAVGATAGAILMATCATDKTRTRAALGLVYLAALAWSHATLEGPDSDYHKLLTKDACNVKAVITITGNPVPPGKTGSKHPGEIRKISLYGPWQDCTGCVLAHFKGGTVLTHGETYIVKGTLLKAPETGYGRHLLSLGMRHIIRIDRARRIAPPAGHHALVAQFLGLRRPLGQALTEGMGQETADLYQSMLLGRRDLFPHHIKQHFIRSATLHIFAISGLHVGIIFTALLALLGALGFGKFPRLVLSCLCCLAYVLLTGATPSSVRSGIMLLLMLLPQLLRRPPNSRHCLCLAALAELTVNPLLIYHSGFLFSFLIVGALIYSTPLFRHLKALSLEPWSWLPTCRQKHRALKVPGFMWKYLAPLTIAWLVSLPIAMYLNGMVPLGGLAIGVPTQLLAWALVIVAIPKLLLCLACPPAGRLLGGLMDLAMRALVCLAEWGGNQQVCLDRPNIRGTDAAILILAVFALICRGWTIRPVRYATTAMIVAWLALAFGTGRPENRVTITVATGTRGGVPALAIRHENREHNMLVNTGTPDSANAIYRHVHLRQRKRLDTICLADLNGALERNLKATEKQDMDTVCLLKKERRQMPPGLEAITARGVHLTLGTAPADLTRLSTGQYHRIRLEKTRGSLQLTYTDDCLQLTMRQIPDGRHLLVARTKQDAAVRILPRCSQETIHEITLAKNTRNTVLY